MSGTIGAVVVDHDAGPLLDGCVRSLLDDGASPRRGGGERCRRQRRDRPGGSPGTAPDAPVRIVRPGRNLGFGAGVNRGLAALAGESAPPEWVLVSQPGSRSSTPARWPRCARRSSPSTPGPSSGRASSTEAGEVYPSVRNFPSFTDAAGHALLALFNPENPFTLRYNPGTPEGERGHARPGGCRARASWPAAARWRSSVASTRPTSCTRGHGPVLARPRRRLGRGLRRDGGGDPRAGGQHGPPPVPMMLAHHRSALRFTFRTTKGWRRAALPLAVLVLGVRLAMATLRLAFAR